MPHITLSQSAVDKLMADPKLRRWREGEPDRRVPILGYFRRSYTTLHDGTVVDHGNGFMLATIDPEDAEETKGIVLESVAVAGGLDILVGASPSVMSGSFTIGWSDWKFTYEPTTGSSKGLVCPASP